MIAFKGFNKDLTCRGYKFSKTKVNREKAAKAVNCGLHCAANPLDCLRYYSDMENAVYYKVSAEGNVNEDGTDTKIACTEMRLLEELDLRSFVMYAAEYIVSHPHLKDNSNVSTEKGMSNRNHFAIVRGKQPKAAGSKDGDVLVMLQEYAGSKEIKKAAMYIVGQNGIKCNTYYNIFGKKVV